MKKFVLQSNVVEVSETFLTIHWGEVPQTIPIQNPSPCPPVYFCIHHRRQSFKSHPLLDFCWVDSPVENLPSTIILHYTGSSKKDAHVFDKTKYRLYSPFYDDLSSIFVVQTINSYQHCLNCNRITLKDTAIIILFDNIGNQSQAKAEIAFRYFSRYLDTEISIHHKQEEEQIWQNKNKNTAGLFRLALSSQSIAYNQ